MIKLSSRSKNGTEGDAFRRQHDAWRRRYAEALMLKDRYPQIEQLIVEMQFIDPLALGTYSPTLHSFGPPAKAFLGVPCPRTLCLEGGFEIEPIVLRLLRSGGTCASGTIVCCGTIKQLEIGPTQCQLQMNYRVEVRYERVMKEA